jgi:hypothetical protein
VPDTYERPRRSWSYEDDDYRACGGYQSYRRDLDSGVDVSSNPPPWQYGEDYRERQPRGFQDLGGELPTYLSGERAAEPEPEVVERGTKRFHRLFGGRKPRRTKEAKGRADKSGEDVDAEMESISRVSHNFLKGETSLANTGMSQIPLSDTENGTKVYEEGIPAATRSLTRLISWNSICTS